MAVTIPEGTAGRPSVIGRLRGSGGGRSLMLNAHMDTVGIERMADASRPPSAKAAYMAAARTT